MLGVIDVLDRTALKAGRSRPAKYHPYGGSPIPVESLDRAKWRFLKKTPLDRIGSALYQLENRYKVEIKVILLKPISIYIFLLERKSARQASGAGFCAAIDTQPPGA